MQTALLALLGVDLIVVVALAAFVFTRKGWVKRQLGTFGGAIAGATVGSASTPVAVAAREQH